ncbi:MAG TPA: DUF2231 domain-containing protein [Dongiaceae bacterium]|jgi:uncharacterized membrane protein|nr:DUF2231 domain-containing protein [Dongiaceae bacterium]
MMKRNGQAMPGTGSATELHNPASSEAAIVGHPLHPSLIPFPVVYLFSAALTDIAFNYTQDQFWLHASLWLIGAGVIMAAVAGIFGAADFLSRRAIREENYSWYHGLGNGVILILALINWIMRLSDRQPGQPLTLGNGEMTLSIVCALGVLVTAWIGGEMVYKRLMGTHPQAKRY